MTDYNIHRIKMSRYSTKADRFCTNKDCFVMTDYFDSMVHVKLENENKTCTKFLGLDTEGEKIDVTEISSRIISMYSENKNLGTIFKAEQKGDFLPDKPFLGVIQISFTSDFFEEMIEEEYPKKIAEVEQQIKGCCGQNEHELYHTLTSGELCLVIRAAETKEIYKVAIEIGNIRCGNEKSKCITYTCVGIQCVYNAGSKKYLTFSNNYIKSNVQQEFVLRFGTIREIYYKILTLDQSKPSGLFGRYDFSVRLTMEQFAELYPEICAYIYGKESSEVPELPEVYTILDLLKWGLQKRKIHILNERLLIPLDTQNGTGKNHEISNNKLDDEVKKRNSEILKKYEDLGKWDRMENSTEFRYNYHALGELVRAYSALGYTMDSYNNWKIYNKLLTILFENIETYKNILEYNYNKPSTYINVEQQFLKDLNQTVDALNQYTKFMQGINQQTIQAPNYEIQTKIDAEKWIIAYTTYMKRYMKQYRNSLWRGEKENVYKDSLLQVYPIIYPDMRVDGTLVMSPFNNGKEEKLGGEKIENLRERQVLLICKIPSFEHFGKIYQLLPWSIHEVSHQIIILNRKKRNEAFVTYVISYVIRQLFHLWVIQHSIDKENTQNSTIFYEISEQITEYYVELFKEFLAAIENCNFSELLRGGSKCKVENCKFNDFLKESQICSLQKCKFSEFLEADSTQDLKGCKFKQFLKSMDESDLEKCQFSKFLEMSAKDNTDECKFYGFLKTNDTQCKLKKCRFAQFSDLIDRQDLKGCQFSNFLETRGTFELERAKINVLATAIKKFFKERVNDFSQGNSKIFTWENKKKILQKYLYMYAYEFCKDDVLKKKIQEVNEYNNNEQEKKQWQEETEKIIDEIYQWVLKEFKEKLKWNKEKQQNKDIIYINENKVKESYCELVSGEKISYWDITGSRIGLEDKIEAFIQKINEGISIEEDKYQKALWKSFSFHLINVNYLYFLWNKKTTEVTDIKIKLNDIKEKCQDKMKDMTSFYGRSMNSKSYICDSEVTQIINELELYTSNAENVFQMWEQHMKKVDASVVGRWIEQASYIYRETCSDIIMCTEYGFSQFGYLKFASSVFFEMGGSLRTSLENSQNMERVYLVLSTLEEPTGKSLKEEVKQYVIKESMRILDLIISKVQNKVEKESVVDFFKALRNIVKDFGKEINNIWASEEVWKYIAINKVYEEGIKEQWKEDLKETQVWDYFESAFEQNQYLWDNMIYLVKMSDMYLDKQYGKLSEKCIKHMKEIKTAIISNDAVTPVNFGCAWTIKQNKNNDVTENIMNYYNKLNNEQVTTELNDMINFVEKYYYIGRIEQSQNKT